MVSKEPCSISSTLSCLRLGSCGLQILSIQLKNISFRISLDKKVIVAIDAQYPAIEADATKYMMFLPENELHELSLLFANFLARARNCKSIYLGQNMPFRDLSVAFELYQPDFLLTIITSRDPNISPQDYLNNLSEKFPDTQILVSGSQVIGQDLDLNNNIIPNRQPKSPNLLY